MAKLQTPNKAGFNANNGYTVKLVKIDDIIIDPEIAGIFNISDNIKNGILEQMKLYGYNKEEPVTLWGKILVDGRTRYTSAKEAGLKEIPAIEREFEDREAAMMYTLERQALRRNLTSAEIMKAARTLLSKKKAANGAGRATDKLAKLLGVHVSTLYQAEAVLREAPEEIVKAVENGEMSLKKGYSETKRREKPEVSFSVTDAQGLPENVKFLKSAVVLLIEGKRKQTIPVNCLDCHERTVELLVNHFLKKNERRGFYELLPDAVKEQLSRLPLVVQTTN